MSQSLLAPMLTPPLNDKDGFFSPPQSPRFGSIRLGASVRTRRPVLPFHRSSLIAAFLFAIVIVQLLFSFIWSPTTPHRINRLRVPFLGGSRRLPSSLFPFQPPPDPIPVHHDPKQVVYSNHPLSIHRPPSTQFTLAPNAKLGQPVVGVITTVLNPGSLLRDTADSLFGQSLQNFVWVIVDDQSSYDDSVTLLADLARDPRIVVVRNEVVGGSAHSINVGIRYLLNLASPPPYICQLPEADMLEVTALEKLA
ncbi:hypothetical protein T439DRAFT_380986 [Meredithblackwellia eburnea MCA 4105]